MSFYDKMYALVKEMDEKLEQLEETAAQALRRNVFGEIAGNLGTVTVAGDGRLVSVDLNTRRLPYLDGAAVGKAVLQAVRETSARAAKDTLDSVVVARERCRIE